MKAHGIAAMFVVCLFTVAAGSEILNPAPEPPIRDQSSANRSKTEDGTALIDGDIIPSPLGEEGSDRNAIVARNLFWPKDRYGNVEIPYQLDWSIKNSRYHMNAFNAAKADYAKYTCVKWVERGYAEHRGYWDPWVNVKIGQGCFSYIGRQRAGQLLSLGWGCQYKGLAIHEMMHAVGFDHEQTRSDRDNHVQIMFQNIQQGQTFNFKKCDDRSKRGMGGCTSQGYPYDCGSIMHYETYAFKKRGYGDTIRAINCGNYRGKLGQRQGFSTQDVARINRLYKCARNSVSG